MKPARMTPVPTARPSSNKPLRRTLGAFAAAGLLSLGSPAWAENHALILWIGDYGDPRANLPGIDLDAKLARSIAQLMGVPARNVTEVANAQLTVRGVSTALNDLLARIKDGDKVFVYYSGHGSQMAARGGTAARCSEAMYVRDGLFMDSALQESLTKLGQKASQVVVMNDSCFSGGAATRSLGTAMPADAKAKFLPPDFKTNTAVTGGYNCGDAVNTRSISRSLDKLEKDQRGPQVLYVAASTDTQVSFATSRGSAGTLAWAHCLADAATDTNKSGSINGEELQACAQGLLNRSGFKQTIMLQGNAKLPLTFTSAAGTSTAAAPAAAPAPAPAPAPAAAPVAAPSPAPVVVAPSPAAAPAPAPTAAAPAPAPTAAPAPQAATPGSPAAAVNPASALQDLAEAADRSYQVQLVTARDSMRIGQDLLDFTVTTNRDGYLYILQVGSDGKTFNLLFPNKLDANNQVSAGSHRFPRPNWRVRSGGPAGMSHLLAIVSPEKKDIGRDMDARQVFASAPANAAATRTLIVEATGAAGGNGRYGASAVVSIREVP